MNELALFAGSGGGLLGTHAVGINPVCGVEINGHCRRVLVRRQNEGLLPGFPIWDDIHTFAGERWRGTVDLVSGGFPCQAFSTAARGRNNALNLWPEMRRIISETEPSYVFAENVTAAAIESAGEDLAEMGYTVEMLPLSAADMGADHVRERFWLLAHPNNKSELQRTINAKMACLPEFRGGLWEAEPRQPRVFDGIARRVDRYSACGNGQVPAVAAAALFSLANN